MLTVHVLDQLHHHRSNVAHGVEVPAGARLLFTNGQVGTKPDGSTPEATAEQVGVIFDRLKAVLKAADMTLNDIVCFDFYVTDRADIDPFAEVRDRIMGDHKPGTTLLVVNGLARPELKIEIEAVAAKVD